MDPGLFLLVQDPRKSYKVQGAGGRFQSQIRIGIRVVAKSAGSENIILHLQYVCHTRRRSFETADFSTEKVFTPVLLPEGLI
jgi:hypothetical protein